METTENVRNQPNTQPGTLQIADKPRPDYQLSSEELLDLSPKQDLFIDYMAFGAFSLDSAGMMSQMTAEQVAAKLGVTDRTLRRWRRSIPGYGDLVRKRRMEKFRIEIEDGVWRGLIAKALVGEPKQAEMVLSHFSDYTPPAQKVDHKVEGLADLVQLARAAARGRGVAKNAPLDSEEADSAPFEAEVVQSRVLGIDPPQIALERAEAPDVNENPGPVAIAPAYVNSTETMSPPMSPANSVMSPPPPAPSIRVIQPPDEPEPEFDDLP
jgi:hypothetical protein